MSTVRDMGAARAALREVHVTPRGAAVLGSAALVAVWLPGALAWLAAALSAVAWVAAVARDLASVPRADDLGAERTLPVKLSLGAPNPVTLTLRNRSRLRVRLSGRETPPPQFAGQRVFGPLEIPPRGEAHVSLSFVPTSRGAHRFGDVGVRLLGPIGLAGRQLTLPLAEDVRVYPDITAVHAYALLARRGALPEMGVRQARLAGHGTEFESLREYQPGDDYGDIDWKATARRGSPVVRLYEVERSQTMVLAVDAGRLMAVHVGELTKLDRAVNAALLLAYVATRAGDSVGLLVFGRDVEAYLPPRKGHRQFLRVLEALYAVEPRIEEPDYQGALGYLARRLGKRSLVVLFSELVGAEPSRRLLGVLSSLPPRHLPLVVTQRNREIESLAAEEPRAELDVYRSAVAQDLLHDKAAATRVLTSRGALVLDVEPERLSVAAVNRYLELKARGLL